MQNPTQPSPLLACLFYVPTSSMCPPLLRVCLFYELFLTLPTDLLMGPWVGPCIYLHEQVDNIGFYLFPLLKTRLLQDKYQGISAHLHLWHPVNT